MKNGLRATIALIMSFLMVLTVFTACTSKKNNTDDTTTLAPDDNWEPADNYYQPVEITDVELAEIVQKALGDESKDFNGDLNSLTDEQISKVRQAAAVEGYVVKTDEDGKTVLMKDNVDVTEAPSNVVDEVLSKAEVENTTRITPSQYERVSKAAEEKGVTAVTDKEGDVTIIQKVTTTAPPATTAGKTNGTAASSTKATQPTQPTGNNGTTHKITTAITPTANTTAKTTSSSYTHSVNTKAVNKDLANAVANKSNSNFTKNALVSDGVIAVGTTMVDSSDKALDYSSGLIAKFGDDGKKLWSHIVSANDLVTFSDVEIMPDGSIVVVGTTMSTNIVSDAEYKCKGSVEGIICKFASDGSRQWIKTFGGSQGDMIYAVTPSNDGGIIIGGKSSSSDFNLKGAGSGSVKAFISKLDAEGNPVWVRSLSGSKHCAVFDIKQAKDGSIYAIIETVCGDGDFSGFECSKNNRKYCVLTKMTSAGDFTWKKAIWESGIVTLQNLALADDGVVLAGQYSSALTGNEGSFKGIYNGGQKGTFDGIVVKFNSAGEKVWFTPLIGFQNDTITGITRINGGYAVTGYTTSTNRDFAFENKGEYDSFVYTFSNGGAKQAAAAISGTQSDRSMGICGSGNKVFVCGSTGSGDLDFANIEQKGTADNTAAFVFKLSLQQQ